VQPFIRRQTEKAIELAAIGRGKSCAEFAGAAYAIADALAAEAAIPIAKESACKPTTNFTEFTATESATESAGFKAGSAETAAGKAFWPQAPAEAAAEFTWPKAASKTAATQASTKPASAKPASVKAATETTAESATKPAASGHPTGNKQSCEHDSGHANESVKVHDRILSDVVVGPETVFPIVLLSDFL
jgi:hypothetical protein